MSLPVSPPVSPMLARSAPTLPEGGRWRYEPKWDGFRCVVFRDGDDVVLGSRNERPLTRYFPELVDAVRAALPECCVVDGEVVVVGPDGLDFDALSTRIHPADSRVRLLAERTPASFVAFDCLALGDRDLRPFPFADRRSALVEALGAARPPVHLTPLTSDRDLATDWFSRFEGAGLDGVVAKDAAGVYEEGRRVMVKVKHERTADFVVAGLRWYKGAPGRAVGSLLLGLYDGDELRHVGVIGSFPADRRRDLVDELAPYRDPGDHPWAAWAGAESAGPRGAVSRWNAGKDLGFEPLDPVLVVEAAFEHLQGHRLRHTARFRRFRPDRDAVSCTFEQVDVAVPSLLADVFGAGVAVKVGTGSGRAQSAVIVPVPAAEVVVGPWRSRLDPAAAAGVPAHVTLVVPWVPPDVLDATRLAELARVVAGVASFDFALVRTAWFGARVLWVAPEPDEPFRRLTHLVADHFGTAPWGGAFDELVPHLSVGHAGPAGPATLAEAEASVGRALPLAARADEVRVMCSDGARWSTRARVGLDGRGLLVPTDGTIAGRR